MQMLLPSILQMLLCTDTDLQDKVDTHNIFSELQGATLLEEPWQAEHSCHPTYVLLPKQGSYTRTKLM